MSTEIWIELEKVSIKPQLMLSLLKADFIRHFLSSDLDIPASEVNFIRLLIVFGGVILLGWLSHKAAKPKTTLMTSFLRNTLLNGWLNQFLRYYSISASILFL